MSKTLREIFIAALIAKGEKQVESRSSKFIKFTCATGGYFFIGKSGSLRCGDTIAGSVPVSDRIKAELRELAK